MIRQRGVGARDRDCGGSDEGHEDAFLAIDYLCFGNMIIPIDAIGK
jgi:hypothetical protein